MRELIFSLLISLIPLNVHEVTHDESEASARARYEHIAASVAEEAEDSHLLLALYLITVARHESALALPVHTGEVRGDHDRSWGLYQIMCGPHQTDPVPGTDYQARDIVGTTRAATERATEAAAVHLRAHMKRCGARNAPCVFRAYGGVSKTATGPVADRIAARVATFQRLLARIEAE